MTTTTTIIIENADGYFVANLDNKGIRIGLLGCECFDFPAGHDEFERVATLTEETVESAYDEYFCRYCCCR